MQKKSASLLFYLLHSGFQVARFLLVYSYEAIVLLFGLLFTPVLLLTLLVLPILSFIPQLYNLAMKTQTIFVSYVGDSLIFSDDGVLSKGIVNKVRTDIELTMKQCSKCIVIAHSQGAAITHKAIKSLLRQGIKAPNVFISFGSGLRKLTELPEYADNVLATWFAYYATGFAFIAGCLIVSVGYSVHAPSEIGSSLFEIKYSLLLCFYAIVVCIVALSLRQIGYITYNTLKKKRHSDVKISIIANWVGWGIIVDWGIIVFYSIIYTPTYIGILDNISNSESWHWVVCPILLGLSITFLMHWRYEVGRKSDQKEQYISEEMEWLGDSKVSGYEVAGMHWVDYYANHDPVSNGPLFDYFKPSSYHPALKLIVGSPDSFRIG